MVVPMLSRSRLRQKGSFNHRSYIPSQSIVAKPSCHECWLELSLDLPQETRVSLEVSRPRARCKRGIKQDKIDTSLVRREPSFDSLLHSPAQRRRSDEKESNPPAPSDRPTPPTYKTFLFSLHPFFCVFGGRRKTCLANEASALPSSDLRRRCTASRCALPRARSSSLSL